MTWLLREGDVLAAIEERQRGWQRSLQGAVLINRAAPIHVIPSSLDVAWCTVELEVKRLWMAPRKVALPHAGVGAIVVAPAGSFERWKLQVGDRLEVKGA